jgi:4-hydroxy-tetrahydrodipicolinate reductase
MGQELRELAPQMKFEITCGVGRKASGGGWPPEIALVAGPRAIDPSRVDVVIDFSVPELTETVADWCLRNKKPLVSGVTALDPAQYTILEYASREVPVCWDSNMSMGVNVLRRMIGLLGAFEGYDFQIEEVHHRMKVDSPSGTAKTLQQDLAKAVEGRSGHRPLKDPVSLRGGGIPGLHRVLVMGDEETLVLEHNALNRKVFARGALQAARFVHGRAPAMYHMHNVLGLN